jgi:hypothetical protein
VRHSFRIEVVFGSLLVEPREEGDVELSLCDFVRRIERDAVGEMLVQKFEVFVPARDRRFVRVDIRVDR